MELQINRVRINHVQINRVRINRAFLTRNDRNLAKILQKLQIKRNFEITVFRARNVIY